MSKWTDIIKPKSIIGMIHIHALPGTPCNCLTLKEIIQIAVKEAELYQRNGIQAILLENMHDVPYLNKKVGPEIIASMTVVAQEIRRVVSLPMGIQILAAANKEALAVALSADLQFIRAEGFVFGHVADEGYIDSCAGDLLRYRKTIKAEHIAIITDIKKKHSAHSITADVSIGETAKAAEFFLSDGLIVTGPSTGKEAEQNDLLEVKKYSDLPIIIGSGVTLDNIGKYYDLADAFIVGSYFKENGLWSNPISEERVKSLIRSVNEIN